MIHTRHFKELELEGLIWKRTSYLKLTLKGNGNSVNKIEVSLCFTNFANTKGAGKANFELWWPKSVSQRKTGQKDYNSR